MSVAENLVSIKEKLPGHVTLVAVSKTKPIDLIDEAYQAGQRDFGENYVQELVDKQLQLPKDIRWHFIGHLQSNKVKYIAPFVHLIHGVDSVKLLKEINKQGEKFNKIINCLIQIYIPKEETKFGLDALELENLFMSADFKELKHIKVCGLMGMATNTENEDVIKQEFLSLSKLAKYINATFGKQVNLQMDIVSMGMSGDYKLAIECGSNMIRVGSSIFGQRNYTK
jgi:PLP dependent protein